MRILGAHIRVASGRYVAGFAWVEDDRLIGTDTFPAPADRDEPGQFGELFGRVEGVVAEADPELFVLKVSEINRQKPEAVLAHRAEGIILGAASRRASLPIRTVSRGSLASPAGLDRSAKGAEVVAALCAVLDQRPPTPECCQAAAAAVGGLRLASA